MMNFANTNVTVSADNEISFCGISYMLTDDEVVQVKGIIEGMISTRSTGKSASKSLVFEEDTTKSKSTPIEGKKLWQEDFCTITCALNADGKKEYRLYITCPVKGEKGEKIRYAIKKSAKECGAIFNPEEGAYNAGRIWWVFKTRKEAETYVATRKEYAKKSA